MNPLDIFAGVMLGCVPVVLWLGHLIGPLILDAVGFLRAAGVWLREAFEQNRPEY